jgi:hypothetical protein
VGREGAKILTIRYNLPNKYFSAHKGQIMTGARVEVDRRIQGQEYREGSSEVGCGQDETLSLSSGQNLRLHHGSDVNDPLVIFVDEEAVWSEPPGTKKTNYLNNGQYIITVDHK